MAEEMAKPLAGGRTEAEKCAWACDYYADNDEGFLASQPVQGQSAVGSAALSLGFER